MAWPNSWTPSAPVVFANTDVGTVATTIVFVRDPHSRAFTIAQPVVRAVWPAPIRRWSGSTWEALHVPAH